MAQSADLVLFLALTNAYIKKMARVVSRLKYLSILALAIGAGLLVTVPLAGIACFLIGLVFLAWCGRDFAGDIGLLYFFLGCTLLVPPDLPVELSRLMTGILVGVVIFGALVGIHRHVLKRDRFCLSLRPGEHVVKRTLMCALVTLGFAVGAIEIMFRYTDVLKIWAFPDTSLSFILLLLVLALIGLWEELMFGGVVFPLLQRHFSFGVANLIQAVIYTAMLYGWGYHSFSLLMIAPLALVRGWIVRQTQSLYYLFVMHFVIDAVIIVAILRWHGGVGGH